MTTPDRRHQYYSDEHQPTAQQRRRIQRRQRARVRNRADERFGKINWNAYDHQQLYDMVHTSDPATLGETVQRWAELADRADAATQAVSGTVQKLLLSWRGNSAVGAAASASKLTDWAGDAGETMRGIGDGLATYTNAIVDARNAMPDPVHYTAVQRFHDGYDVKATGPDPAVLAAQLLSDQLPTRQEADRAKAEAVRVMERYEATSKGVHDTLPAFAPTPAAVAIPGDDTTTPSTTSPSAPGTAPGQAGPGTAPGQAGTGNIDSLLHRRTSSPVVSSGAVPRAATTDLTVTKPSSIRDLLGGNGSGGAPGSAFSAGQEALSRGGISGAPGSGSFSGSLPAGGVAGAGATTGAGGMGAGMFPGAGTGQRSDDRDHQNRYGNDSGLDLLDDLPPACPPVIGE